MNRLQYLLTCLAEEGSEVAQIASKCNRFGLYEKQHEHGPRNVDRLLDEMADVLALFRMIESEQGDSFPPNPPGKLMEMVLSKQEKVERYYRYSQSIGIVDADSN